MKPETPPQTKLQIAACGVSFFPPLQNAEGGGCSISILRVEGLKEDMEHMGGISEMGYEGHSILSCILENISSKLQFFSPESKEFHSCAIAGGK